MRLRVIELDNADTWYTVRDRLLNAGPEPIALLPPPGSKLLRSGVDLALLRRLVERERLEVAIVTEERPLIREARAFGIPIFGSTTTAGRNRLGWWRGRRRYTQLGLASGESANRSANARLGGASRWRALKTGLLATVAVLVIAGLLAAAVSVPSATVHLQPAIVPIQIILPMSAGSEADASEHMLPARAIRASVRWESGAVATTRTASELDRLRRLASEGLAAGADSLLSARLMPDEVLVPGSAEITVIDESIEEVDGGFMLVLDSRLAAIGIDETGLGAAVSAALASVTPDGFAVVPGSATVTLEAAETDDRGRFELAAQASARAQIDDSAVHAAVAGQSLSTVAGSLAQQWTLSEPPEIVVQPDWWRRWIGRMPLRASAVQVTIEQ